MVKLAHHAVSCTLGLSNQCEEVTSVEWEIPSIKISINVLPDTTELEERLLHLEHLDEKHRDALTANKAHKNRVKNKYDKSVKPRIFFEGELVLLWDQDKEPLGWENLGLCG